MPQKVWKICVCVCVYCVTEKKRREEKMRIRRDRQRQKAVLYMVAMYVHSRRHPRDVALNKLTLKKQTV